MCRIKENLKEKVVRKPRPSGKVVIIIKEVLVLAEEAVILTLDVVFGVIVFDVEMKEIDPLSVETLVRVKMVTKMS